MRNLLVSLILALSIAFSFSAIAREVAVGEAAPDFSLPAYNQNQPVKLSDYRGKIVLLGFVDTCEPCRIQAQALEAVRSHYGDKIVVIGIVYEDKNGTKSLYNMLNPKPKYPLILDPRHSTESSYGLWGDPQVAIIDAKGKIVYKNYLTESKDLIKVIDKLL